MSCQNKIPGFALVLFFFHLAALFSSADANIINVSETEGTSRNPKMDVGPGPSLHIVWTDVEGEIGRILYRSWLDGSWGDVTTLSDGLHHADEPAVAVNQENGEVLVAWQEEHDGVSKIYRCYGSGDEWTCDPVAPHMMGAQEMPDVHIDADGHWWISWWDIETSGIWINHDASYWNPIVMNVNFGCHDLMDAVGTTALVATGRFQYETDHFIVSLWDGMSWIDPGGEPAAAGGYVSGGSIDGSGSVHLASSPAQLPTCPCHHLIYTLWVPPAEWVTQEVCSETLGDWWFCTEPDAIVDSADRPLIAYRYCELDYSFEAIRKDIVVALQTAPGEWSHTYQGLPFEMNVYNPAIALLNDEPVVAWCGVMEDVRDIWLAMPFPDSGLPDDPILVQRSLLIWPNPSSGFVNMRLNEAPSETVTFRILDITGRQVRTLWLPPGRSVMRWDGRDEAGRPAGAAIYYATVSTRGIQVEHGSIHLVR